MGGCGISHGTDDFAKNLAMLLHDLDAHEGGEDADDLNATLEDVLLLLGEPSADAAEAAEELTDARAELMDLCAAYARIPGMRPYSERLKSILDSEGT